MRRSLFYFHLLAVLTLSPFPFATQKAPERIRVIHEETTSLLDFLYRNLVDDDGAVDEWGMVVVYLQWSRTIRHFNVFY